MAQENIGTDFQPQDATEDKLFVETHYTHEIQEPTNIENKL